MDLKNISDKINSMLEELGIRFLTCETCGETCVEPTDKGREYTHCPYCGATD